MNPDAPRILVVDDHPLLRAGLRAGIIAAFPAALLAEAGSALEALARMSAQRPDLVLLDVNLPGESGIELARRIRAADKGVKILMLAGEVDPWTVNQSVEAGASGFVTKARSAEFLGQAIKAVLDGQLVFCPEARTALQQAERAGGATTEPPGPSVLSGREREILKHLAQGENTKTVACSLRISPKTVETHRLHILRKLGLQSVAELTRYAIRHGLTPA